MKVRDGNLKRRFDKEPLRALCFAVTCLGLGAQRRNKLGKHSDIIGVILCQPVQAVGTCHEI
jgi:hypothetical protein